MNMQHVSLEPVLMSALILISASCGSSSVASSTNPASNPPQWQLVWSDEFNGANGSSPDPSKWTYDIGGGGWGNQELEYYTNRPVNANVQDGNLVITAQPEKIIGSDNLNYNYTSARLKTLGLFSQALGKFEARIKIPYGQGLWPAF
jgi:beta-glucanase (GH16 family)